MKNENEMQKNQTHYLTDIQRDHAALRPAALAHIEACSMCRNELRMMQRIERAVTELPRAPQAVPEKLRVMVFRRLSEPFYRIWHVLAAGLLVLVSPLFIKRLAGHYAGVQLSQDMQLVLFAMYGLLLLLLLLPLTYRLLDAYNQDIHDLERSADDFLEHHSLRRFGGAIRKRVGF